MSRDRDLFERLTTSSQSYQAKRWDPDENLAEAARRDLERVFTHCPSYSPSALPPRLRGTILGFGITPGMVAEGATARSRTALRARVSEAIRRLIPGCSDIKVSDPTLDSGGRLRLSILVSTGSEDHDDQIAFQATLERGDRWLIEEEFS